MKKLLLFLIFLLAVPCYGKDINLKASWLPNSDTDIKAYKIYETTSTRIKIAEIVHPTTSYEFTKTVVDNSAGTLKYLLTAVDTAGNESGDSQVSTFTYNYEIPVPPDTTAPAIPSGFKVEEVVVIPPIIPPVTPPAGMVINDFTFYPVPVMAKPEKGLPFIDPIFHTEIVRITNALTDGVSTPFLYGGYPKHNIENADGTKLIIQGGGGSGWHIWNANPPYNKIKSIPASLIGWQSPIDARWDASDPDVIYYNYLGKFMKYSTSTDMATLLHDFTVEYPPRPDSTEPRCRPHLKEEGDSSADSRYWAFCIYCYDTQHGGDSYYDAAWVVYDKDYFGKDNGKIISTKIDGGTVGFISMSPSGKYVWTGDLHDIYDKNFNHINYVDETFRIGTHADMGTNDEGHDVIFGYAPKPPQDYMYASMVDLETMMITYLTPMPPTGGWHFSGNNFNKPGWGLISSYYPQSPAVDSKWGDHELIMVELTKRTNPTPKVWRLANTRSLMKGYSDAPFGKINRNGTKVWFSTGWGASNYDGAAIDTYQINLNWSTQ